MIKLRVFPWRLSQCSAAAGGYERHHKKSTLENHSAFNPFFVFCCGSKNTATGFSPLQRGQRAEKMLTWHRSIVCHYITVIAVHSLTSVIPATYHHTASGKSNFSPETKPIKPYNNVMYIPTQRKMHAKIQRDFAPATTRNRIGRQWIVEMEMQVSLTRTFSIISWRDIIIIAVMKEAFYSNNHIRLSNCISSSSRNFYTHLH